MDVQSYIYAYSDFPFKSKRLRCEGLFFYPPRFSRPYFSLVIISLQAQHIVKAKLDINNHRMALSQVSLIAPPDIFLLLLAPSSVTYETN